MPQRIAVGSSAAQIRDAVRVVDSNTLEITAPVSFYGLKGNHPLGITIQVRPGRYQFISRRVDIGQLWLVLNLPETECGVWVDDVLPE